MTIQVVLQINTTAFLNDGLNTFQVLLAMGKRFREGINVKPGFHKSPGLFVFFLGVLFQYEMISGSRVLVPPTRRGVILYSPRVDISISL